MTIRDSLSFELFDRYSVVVPEGLRYEYNDKADKRVLSITAVAGSFVITFEEGMPMNDMKPSTDDVPCVRFQCCHQDGKYIHLRRGYEGVITEALFHFEHENADGVIHYLPGRMNASADYKWSDGIEPTLMALMEDLDLL